MRDKEPVRGPAKGVMKEVGSVRRADIVLKLGLFCDSTIVQNSNGGVFSHSSFEGRAIGPATLGNGIT
jgi:hypothetical protein